MRRYLLLILVLLCATVLCLPNVNIENTPVPSVGAEQVYTIGSDYSVSPSDGPLAFDGADYVLTDDLVGSIEVYAADIIIDGRGHTLVSELLPRSLFCAGVPFALGILLLVLAWQSRTARWMLCLRASSFGVPTWSRK